MAYQLEGLAPLSRLPAVPLDLVLENLDLASIKNLRLTSRWLSDNCLGPRFKSFLREPTTDLSRSSLDNLDALVSHPYLRSTVKSITIMALTYNTSALYYIISGGRRANFFRRVYHEEVKDSFTPEEMAAAKEEYEWIRLG